MTEFFQGRQVILFQQSFSDVFDSFFFFSPDLRITSLNFLDCRSRAISSVIVILVVVDNDFVVDIGFLKRRKMVQKQRSCWVSSEESMRNQDGRDHENIQ